MREHTITFPELALISATRGMIGLGIGLLASEHLGSERRRAVGLTLLIAGALSTIPIAIRVFRAKRRGERRETAAVGDRYVDDSTRARAASVMVE